MVVAILIVTSVPPCNGPRNGSTLNVKDSRRGHSTCPMQMHRLMSLQTPVRCYDCRRGTSWPGGDQIRQLRSAGEETWKWASASTAATAAKAVPAHLHLTMHICTCRLSGDGNRTTTIVGGRSNLFLRHCQIEDVGATLEQAETAHGHSIQAFNACEMPISQRFSRDGICFALLHHAAWHVCSRWVPAKRYVVFTRCRLLAA